jgi:hypothetical protein
MSYFGDEHRGPLPRVRDGAPSNVWGGPAHRCGAASAADVQCRWHVSGEVRDAVGFSGDFVKRVCAEDARGVSHRSTMPVPTREGLAPGGTLWIAWSPLPEFRKHQARLSPVGGGGESKMPSAQ